jgi:hypothetical protein
LYPEFSAYHPFVSGFYRSTLSSGLSAFEVRRYERR